jgi:holliday junction DNA helicase RuvA
VIGRLTGRVVEEAADGTIVIDVNGVGYEVLVPLGSLGRLRGASGSNEAASVTLFVHTHVREDAFSLFGFASAADREAFRTLLAVSGIGPRIAVAVLSALPAAELGQAIARKEIGRLTAISGVGKKTAERMLLELRDKLPQGPVSLAAAAAGDGPTALIAAPKGGARELLSQALVRMGYRAGEADRAIDQLGDRVTTLPLGESVREALLLLSK